MIDREPGPRRIALIDDQGQITQDLPCRMCGYNLRGLASSAACPECLTPAVGSIRHDLLKLCDPAWVKRLESGARLAAIGALGCIVLYAIAVVLHVVVGSDFAKPFGPGWAASAVAMAAGWLVIAAGTWKLTAPEPEASGGTGMTPRSLARWCMLAQVAAAPLQIIAGGFPLAFTVIAFASTVLGMVGLVGQAAVMFHLRTLALRIPGNELARHTLWAAWGLVFCEAVGMVVAATCLAGAAVPSRDPAGASPILAATSFISGAGAWLVAIWILGVLIACTRAFRQASLPARPALAA